MLKANQSNLSSNMNIRNKDLHAYQNDASYKYVETNRILFDRINKKDPLTIYIVTEPDCSRSVYMGNQQIPNEVFVHPSDDDVSDNFTKWLPTYLRYLIVEYHDNTILSSNPDYCKPSIICNILQATNKYDFYDLDIMPLYLRGTCRGSLELMERMDFLKGPFNKVMDVFAAYNFFTMINNKHTDEDADKYDIDTLAKVIISVLN